MNKKINFGLNEGDVVKLTYSPCKHYGIKNAYIGFEGIVKLGDHIKDGKFSLFSGKSWLTNLNINTDKFEIIKKNTSGLFSINGVDYYSESSVIHKPAKCCKCGFIPVEYIQVNYLFWNKYYCSNCKK